MEQSDKELIKKLKKKNKKAFEFVFKKYYQVLKFHALRYLHEPSLAEEIVQDFFLKLWNKIDDIDINTSLKSYFYRSIGNACLNHIKHLKVKQKYHNYIELEIQETPKSGYDILFEKQLEDIINTAINKLPEKRKEIFVLSRFKNLKYHEIAKKLDISIKTVESNMSKALKFLREELSDFYYLIFIILLS